MNTAGKRIGLSFLPIVCCLLLWESISRTHVINPLLFPPPSAVILALWELILNGTLLTDTAISFWRVLAGLSVGIVVGIVCGLLTGRILPFDRALSPIIHSLRPLPPVAIIPLIIVWFGIGDTAKIFSIALASFFPVWLNTHLGAQQIPQEFLWSAGLLTTSRFNIFARVILPASLPFIIAGVRTAIAIAFIMVFVSELAGAESGLGYRISITQLAFRVDQMMAGLIVLSALSFLTDRMFLLLMRRMFPWTTLK